MLNNPRRTRPRVPTANNAASGGFNRYHVMVIVSLVTILYLVTYFNYMVANSSNVSVGIDTQASHPDKYKPPAVPFNGKYDFEDEDDDEDGKNDDIFSVDKNNNNDGGNTGNTEYKITNPPINDEDNKYKTPPIPPKLDQNNNNNNNNNNNFAESDFSDESNLEYKIDSLPILWPIPKEYKAGQKTISLSKEVFVNAKISSTETEENRKFIDNAISMYKNYIFENKKNPPSSVTDRTQIKSVFIKINNQWPEKEAYELSVQFHKILIIANDRVAVLRAFETLSQLVNECEKEECYVTNAPVKVTDRPEFSYRGVMIDTGRNYYQVSTIKLILDVSMQIKLNALHWHLTDAQRFSFGSEKHPKLSKPYEPFYSFSEIREVVDYAYWRGIEILPEIDMPAHTLSWKQAYPDAVIHHPPTCDVIAILDVSKNSTMQLVEDLISESSSLFPFNFIHMGGDEVETGRCVTQEVRERLDKLVPEGGDKYLIHAWKTIKGILDRVASTKTPVMWDEWMGVEQTKNWWDPNKPWRDPIIECWRGTKEVRESTEAGYRIITGYGWYLNAAPEGCVSWEDCYYHSPSAVKTGSIYIPLTGKQRELVLGGEGCAWELPEQCFHERVWHKLFAISERLWSDPKIDEKNRFTPNFGTGCHSYREGPKLTKQLVSPTTNLNQRYNFIINSVFDRHNLEEQYSKVFKNRKCTC